MRKPLSALAGVAILAAFALPAPGMAAPEHAKVGTLTCDISAGIGLIITSKKDVTCMFTPDSSRDRRKSMSAASPNSASMSA